MLEGVFERVYVVSLADRADRWEAFQKRLPSDWPFGEPVRFEAVDGKLAPHPPWWRGGPGAWGCYRSHLRILEDCLNKNVPSVLLLEDDAVFAEGFSEKVDAFFHHLPEDWSFVYLGGQHIQQDVRLPRKINDWVYRPFNVNRTHCFGLRGRAMMELVYCHLNHYPSWTADHHVDHHLGELHKRLDGGLYAPREWLVTQDEGLSNVTGRASPHKLFRGAEALTTANIDLKMVAVLGQFRGGTSCLAGMLHNLGVNMGAKFVPPNDNNPKGYFEAERIAKIGRAAFIEPWLVEDMFYEDRVNLLRRWAGDRCDELRGKAAFAGAKHPTLCLMGPDLVEAWNDPFFIVVERPVEESVQSLLRANWHWPHAAIRYALPLMVEAREAFLKKYAPKHLPVSFARTLLQPEHVLDEVCAFLGCSPAEEQRKAAISFVEPRRKR